MSSPIVVVPSNNNNNNGQLKVNVLKSTPGRAAVFAFGRAFPRQEVKQEFLTEGYLRDTNCNDPVLKAKLERLCEFWHKMSLYIFSRTSKALCLITNKYLTYCY